MSTSGDLLTLLGGHDPVGVVFYRDDEAREDLVELCKLLSSTERPRRRSTTIEDVFRIENENVVLLLTPLDEAAAIRTLEGRREGLLAREAPAILFLMQDGEAERLLNRKAPALSSFLRGLTYDPEPPRDDEDLAKKRESFRERHAWEPDEWLRSWRRGEMEDTADNNLTAHEAWALQT